jgi:hypothetical protein
MADTEINLNLTPPAENEKAVSVVIDWKQLVNNAPAGESNGDTQTYKLFPLKTGTIVRNVFTVVEENFTGTTSPLFSIGDDDDLDGYMTAKVLDPQLAARASASNGDYFDATDTTSSAGETDDVTVTLVSSANSKIYSYDDTSTTKHLIVRFQANDKLGASTAGRLRIIADVIFGNLL